MASYLMENLSIRKIAWIKKVIDEKKVNFKWFINFVREFWYETSRKRYVFYKQFTDKGVIFKSKNFLKEIKKDIQFGKYHFAIAYLYTKDVKDEKSLM